MYFEFESESNNETECSKNSNSKSSTIFTNDSDSKACKFPVNNNNGAISPLSSSSFSHFHKKKSFVSSSLSSSPSSSLCSTPVKSQFLSPLKASSPFSPQRHRRYSMHAGQSSLTLDSLQDNNNVTFCDLALITKKKLLQLNCSPLKAVDENNVDPDIKLNQALAKHSNSDLRREVLLASMQRSLSVSSDDLHSLSSLSGKDFNSTNDMTKSFNKKNGANQIEDCSMDMSFSNQKNSNSISAMVTNSEESPIIEQLHTELKKSPLSRILKSRRNLSGIYTPSENQINLNSLTTFTSTTSMAGSKNANANMHQSNNSRNHIKKLNVNTLNLLGGNGLSNTGSSYYSHSNTPKLTLTMSSSMLNSSLKKRLHSSSPSKFSSPYHTISSSICKDFNVIFANASNQLLPEWDMAFKRLKVMHCGTQADSTEPESQCGINQSTHFGSTNCQPENELNELAQDLHRLKTPFT